MSSESSASERVARDLPVAKLLAFSLLPAFLLFGGAELALRTLGLPQEKYLLEQYEFPPPGPVNVGFEDDLDLFWRLRPGYDGPWTYWRAAWGHEGAVPPHQLAARRASLPDPASRRGITWQVNEAGFRGPLVEDAEHCILLVGSSITFGWGVRWEHSFAGRLAGRLRRAGLSDWSVIDAGVPGYTSYQSLGAMRRWLERRPVRAVVFEAGVNDGMFAPVRRDRDMALLGRPRHESRWWSHSNLYLLLHFALRDATARPEPAERAGGPRFYASRVYRPGRSRVSPGEFAENLDAARALAREHGAAAVFLIPVLFNEYGEERILPAARYGGPDVIALAEALAEIPREERARYFLPYDEAHFSRRGHALVAELIWERLRAEGVLPVP